VCSDDKTIKLWDLITGKEIYTFTGIKLMYQLENVLTKSEIEQLKKTYNLKSTESKLVLSMAQAFIYFPFTYEYAVKKESEDLGKDVENPLKTILITSWLCHAANQGKLAYNHKPIRLKMDDFLVHHIWSPSLQTKHYSMCVESLYLFYQQTSGFKTEFLSLDQMRVYPALKSDKPKLKGKQSSYLKVKEQICQVVEQAFMQHNLHLPTPPKVYDPLNGVDVNEWFSKILNINNANSIEINKDILDHVSQVKAVCDSYVKPKHNAKDIQPVWISF
jgi:hypothetical protein